MKDLNTLFIKAKNKVNHSKEQLYIAFISYENMSYKATCCFMKNGKEVRRDTTSHKTKDETLQYIQNMVDKYPYEMDTIVIYGSEYLL